MKSVEDVFKHISSTANDTITEGVNYSLMNNNQSLSSNIDSNNNRTKTNSSQDSDSQNSRWTLSSYQTSIKMKPVEIMCQIGAILMNDKCGTAKNVQFSYVNSSL